MAPTGKSKAKAKAKGKGKSKQTHRKTTPSASNPAAAARIFPEEVIFDILTRLPVKTLLRFKCVSKQWRTLVSLPRFISVHLSRSPASLLIRAHKTPIPVDQEPQPQLLPPDGHVIYAYGPPNPQSSTISRILDFPGSDVVGFDHLEVIGGAPNGVVCVVQQPFAQKFTLWNPATRSSLNIPASGLKPNPSIHAGASAGLGFDPTCNEYKIIRIIQNHPQPTVLIPDAAEVFNFKTGRWTLLSNNGAVRFRVVTATCEAMIKGVPYWKVWGDDVDFGTRPMLLSFDVKKLVFNLEWFAWALENKGMCMGEIYGGCLGAMVWDVEKEMSADRVLDVWMKEYESGWSKIYRVEGLPEVGRVVGFYGDRGIVQEVVGEDGNHLCMINLENMEIEDFFRLDSSWPGTYKVARYRESLTRMPRIGSSII